MYQEGSGGFLKKNLDTVLLLQWFGRCSEPLDLQLKHIQKPAKTAVFELSF